MKIPWNLVLLCASLVVGVGLFEVVVRASGKEYELTPNWKYHPVLGWSQVPNGRYDFTLGGRPVHVSFNSMGFRDRERQRAKPPGSRRIVVIGDSFCEAVQVNLEETFHQRLEALLNARDSTPWEVINLGVGDFGTAQQYIALREYGLAFEPDVVIHQIFPLNDICNNSVRLHGLCRSHNDRYRPYFVEAKGGLRQVSAQPIRTYLRRHVVTYHVLESWLLKRLGPDPQSPDDPGRPRRLRARGYKGLDPLLSTYVDAADQPEAVADGWRITERLIERIVDTTRAEGIAYLGLVIPFELRLGPGWEDFAGQMPPPPMNRWSPEERLSAFFDRLGVPSVMAFDAFQPYLDEVVPYVGGHLSPAGHRRAAEALCRQLVESGIVAPGTGSDGPQQDCTVAPPAVPGDVSLPLRVDIGDRTARRWMQTGWHGDETVGDRTFVWSDNARSVLAVPLPAGGDIRMEFEAHPFAYPDSPPQRVTLVLNGSVIEEIHLRSGLQKYSVMLPAGALSGSLDTIEFRYAYARMPREVLRKSPDTRLLAVAWYSIDFTAVAP